LKSEGHSTEKERADGGQREPSLDGFKNDPVKGAPAILRLRSKGKIDSVLSNVDFVAGLKKLASDATAAPKAAVALSKFVMRPEFFNTAAVAVQTAGSWTEPSNFDAEDRRLAADALERLRPSWGLTWLMKAMVAGDRSPALRRYFATRLILVSGGLPGAVDALAKALSRLKPKAQLCLVRELRDCARSASAGAKPSAFIDFAKQVLGASGPDGAQLRQEVARLLCEAASADRGLPLDEEFVGLVTALDAAAGAKLREEAGTLGTGSSGLKPPPDEEPQRDKPDLPDQATILREAAWSDADEALARALRDMDFMARSFEQLDAVASGEAADRARHAPRLKLQHRRIEAVGHSNHSTGRLQALMRLPLRLRQPTSIRLQFEAVGPPAVDDDQVGHAWHNAEAGQDGCLDL
jgi:hypothetical protein